MLVLGRPARPRDHRNTKESLSLADVSPVFPLQSPGGCAKAPTSSRFGGHQAMSIQRDQSGMIEGLVRVLITHGYSSEHRKNLGGVKRQNQRKLVLAKRMSILASSLRWDASWTLNETACGAVLAGDCWACLTPGREAMKQEAPASLRNGWTSVKG